MHSNSILSLCPPFPLSPTHPTKFCNFIHLIARRSDCADAMASKRAWSWKEDYREVVSDAVRRSKEGSVRAPLRIRVLTYNILANRLAEEHYWQLYQGIPKWILDFNFRLRNLCAELELCKPDVVCLQVRPSRRPITQKIRYPPNRARQDEENQGERAPKGEPPPLLPRPLALLSPELIAARAMAPFSHHHLSLSLSLSLSQGGRGVRTGQQGARGAGLCRGVCAADRAT